MIYTLGRIDIYEPYIKKDKNASKRKGGSVFKTKKEAGKYSNKIFKVYGVIAEWNIDTVYDEFGDGWHKLKRNAKLIKL